MTTHSTKQIEHTSEWIATWYNSNRETLKTKGIQAADIYADYLTSTSFPMGPKSFFMMLIGINISGGTIQKYLRSGVTYYAIMD